MESPGGLKSVAKVAVIRMILMPFTAIAAIRKYWRIIRNRPSGIPGDGSVNEKECLVA